MSVEQAKSCRKRELRIDVYHFQLNFMWFQEYDFYFYLSIFTAIFFHFLKDFGKEILLACTLTGIISLDFSFLLLDIMQVP